MISDESRQSHGLHSQLHPTSDGLRPQFSSLHQATGGPLQVLPAHLPHVRPAVTAALTGAVDGDVNAAEVGAAGGHGGPQTVLQREGSTDEPFCQSLRAHTVYVWSQIKEGLAECRLGFLGSVLPRMIHLQHGPLALGGGLILECLSGLDGRNLCW